MIIQKVIAARAEEELVAKLVQYYSPLISGYLGLDQSSILCRLLKKTT